MPRKWIEEGVAADRLRRLPSADNARRGDSDGIATSIEEFDFWGVIVAQHSTGNIIVGNHRYDGGLQAGETHFDVQWWDVTDEVAERMGVADNRWGDRSHFDIPVLTKQMARWDTDQYAGTGFTPDDLDTMLERLADGAPLPQDANTLGTVRFLLGAIEFLLDGQTAADWATSIEHEAGPRLSEQEAEVRRRLEIPDGP